MPLPKFGQPFHKLDNQFINQQPVHKLVKFPIGSHIYIIIHSSPRANAFHIVPWEERKYT